MLPTMPLTIHKWADRPMTDVFLALETLIELNLHLAGHEVYCVLGRNLYDDIAFDLQKEVRAAEAEAEAARAE